MWLILGGYGQLGKCLQDSLNSRGISFTAMGHNDVDITEFAAVSTVMQQIKPDVVVNAAAWTAVDNAEDHEEAAYLVNCIGARNIAKCVARDNSVLVHISTDYVFSGSSSSPLSETDQTSPLSAYGRTKLAGELAVLEENSASSLIVRTAWLYSPFGSNFARTMVRKALKNDPVRVVDDQYGQPTLASDLADHVLTLVEGVAPSGIYHGTNSGKTSWFEFATEIFRLVGSDPELVTAVHGSEYPTRAMRPQYSVLSHGNTIRSGFEEMQPWMEALAQSIPQIVARINQE